MSTTPPSRGRTGIQTEIVDEGGLHKFRTEIPNTVVRGLKSHGLSVYAKWLYVYFKSVAGEDSVCWRSTTTIASESGISRGQVSEAKKELITAGLITIKKGKNPKRDADHIRIKGIWLANMQEFTVHNTNTEDEYEITEPQGSDLSSVHNTNTENSQSSQYEHQSSQYELGVRIVNQRRSQEEDPKKKENPPVSPHGGIRAKKKPVLLPMPEDQQAQDTLKTSIFDDAFESWRQGNYPEADAGAQWAFFVSRCLARELTYARFRQAFQNSFTWANSPAQRGYRGAARASPEPNGRISEKGRRSVEAAKRIIEDLTHGTDAPHGSPALS